MDSGLRHLHVTVLVVKRTKDGVGAQQRVCALEQQGTGLVASLRSGVSVSWLTEL